MNLMSACTSKGVLRFEPVDAQSIQYPALGRLCRLKHGILEYPQRLDRHSVVWGSRQKGNLRQGVRGQQSLLVSARSTDESRDMPL